MSKTKKHRRDRHRPGPPHPSHTQQAPATPAAGVARPAADPAVLVEQAFARWDKPARAIDALDRAIAAQPERADLWRLRGHLLRRVGRLKPAADDLATAVRLAPGDRQLAYEAALVRLAAGETAPETPAAAGEPAPATRLAALAAARRADLPAAEAALAGAKQPLDRLLLGALMVAQGQSARGAQLLGAADDGVPPAARPLAHLYRGVAHAQRRELAQAAAALERARELGAPPLVDTYLTWVYQQQAMEAVLAEDHRRAAERFQRLAGLGGPDAAQARANAAAALSLHGQERAQAEDYEEAIDAWTEALAITPQDAALRQHLAVALERAGRTDEAIPHWHELIRMLPRGEGRASKPGRQAMAGQDEEPDLHRHTRAVAHRHLADLYLDDDEVERAIDHLEKAILAVPADAEARRTLARLLLEEGRAKAAVRHLEQLVAADPDNAADRLDLGIALLHTGAHDAAREHLERALALEPESPVIKLALGSALVRNVLAAPDRPEALRDAQRAVDLAVPAHKSMSLGALGAAQLARGDLRAAKKTLRQAVTAAPDKGLTNIRVGHIYWRAGYTTEALAAWTTAM